MSFFGGKKVELIEEPKKEGFNLFNEYKKTLEGYRPNEELLVPLLNWYSNNKHNILAMQNINRHFFFVNKNILTNNLTLNIDRAVRFIKYPKKNKDEHELAFLIPYIQRYYGWSDREWEYYKEFIDLEDTELHEKMHRLYVFEDKERRKLGIKKEKIKAKFEEHRKVKGFF